MSRFDDLKRDENGNRQINDIEQAFYNLTTKQQHFVEEYLICLNPKESALKAGYAETTAKTNAYLLVEDLAPFIRWRMQERARKLAITQEEVLLDLVELKNKALGRIPTRISTKAKDGVGQLELFEFEEYVFEPNAANKALELIGKHLGMFTPKLELQGEITNKNVLLNSEEFREIAKELLNEI